MPKWMSATKPEKRQFNGLSNIKNIIHLIVKQYVLWIIGCGGVGRGGGWRGENGRGEGGGCGGGGACADLLPHKIF